MTNPALSITIPTYNRARYLKCLLESLVHQARALKCSYEILIADNASADDTEAVVAGFKDQLPIRYIKRDKNYGAVDNRALLFKEAQGAMQCYVADDDDLILSEVNDIVKQMQADPAISAVFAPWRIYDRVGKKALQNFYSHPGPVTIGQGHYDEMLCLILDHHIFPEICIIRSDILRATMPFAHPLAYWAFVQTAEYLERGKAVFRSDPFYISITRYFEDDDRRQIGFQEAQEGWDFYRGGLEYLLSRIPSASLSPQRSGEYLAGIQKFVALRMQVAIRLRLQVGRDPIDTYYLACRVKAMGYPAVTPESYEDLRVQAAAQYAVTGGMASDAIDKIVCVGNIPPALYQALKMRAGTLPVIVTPQADPEKHPHAVMVVAGRAADAGLDNQRLAARHIRLIGADDLLRKFA